MCRIIFAKNSLLLCVYLTSLQKNYWLAYDITDTVCHAQGLVKSETIFEQSVYAGSLISKR